VSDSRSGSDASAYLAAGACALAAAAFFLVPLCVTVALWFAVRDRLTRREYLVALSCSVVALVLLVRAGALVAYSSWMWAAVSAFPPQLSRLPWLFTAAAAVLMCAVWGLVSSTRLTSRLPQRMRGREQGRALSKTESLIPTADVKEEITAVPLAPGAESFSSTVDLSAPVGKRKFQLAVSSSGAPVYLGEEDLATHMVLLGTTGSGKTEMIKAIASSVMDLGHSVLVLDMKEDTKPGALRDWLADYAMYHQMPFQQLCLSAPVSDTWFNPLAGLGPDDMRDLILQLQKFDDQYWQAINKELLGKVINLMVWAHQADPAKYPPPSMYELGKILGAPKLNVATRQMVAAVHASQIGVSRDEFDLLLSPPKDTQQSATGYAAKMNQLFETQAGRQVLRPSADGTKKLLDVTAPGLAYIGLDMQGKPDLAPVISSAVLQRISVYAAARNTGQVVTSSGGVPPLTVIVDEAGVVNREIVQNILARARSAGISMILCTQGPLDWIDDNGDDWGKMTQNTNVMMIMKQGSPESAEICANFIGKAWRDVSSISTRTAKGLFRDTAVRDERGRIVESESVRSEYLHLVDPDELREMGRGEFVVRVGIPLRLEWGYTPMREPNANPGRWEQALKMPG